MTRLRISVEFDVPETSREQARIMASLDDAAKEFETSIKLAADVDATFEMRVIRHKESKVATPAVVKQAAE